MADSSCSALALFGRALLSLVFIFAGINKFVHFSMMAGMLVSKGFPDPTLFLGCAAALELFGGLAILIGFRTRIVAWVLFFYLIPVTFLFHNFWASQGMERMDNQAHFLKNLAIMGGLLLLASFGAGDCSVDSKCAPRPE